MIRKCILLIIGFTLFGCSSLDARRVEESHPNSLKGAPYTLGFTQFDVNVIRQVASCEIEEGGGKVPAIKIATLVDISQKEKMDPSQRYVIDLNSVGGFLKKSGINVAYYDNGALKSINANVDDQTGEVAADATTLMLKLATGYFALESFQLGSSGTEFKSAQGIEGQSPSETSIKRYIGCSDRVKAAMKAAEEIEEALEDTQRELARHTARVSHLTSLISVLGRKDSTAERRELAGAMTALEKSRQDIDLQTRKISEHKAIYTHKASMRWPEDGNTFTGKIKDLDDKTIMSWAAVSTVPDFSRNFLPVDQRKLASADLERLKMESAVNLWLEGRVPLAINSESHDSTKTDKIKGIKYRPPAPGTLWFCHAPCQSENVRDDKKKVIGSYDVQASQLGQIFVLPLVSYPLSNKSISASFALDGRPLELGVKRGSGAEKALTTASGVVAGAMDAAETLQDWKLKTYQVETERLKAEIERNNLEAALSPMGKEKRLLEQETALLKAQLARIEAARALEQAQSVSVP